MSTNLRQRNAARKARRPVASEGFTCTICGRTGFDKPTAHGCFNKANEWRAPREAIDRARKQGGAQ